MPNANIGDCIVSSALGKSSVFWDQGQIAVFPGAVAFPFLLVKQFQIPCLVFDSLDQ